ncbi:MAG: putative secreted protease, partial [Conexibacter sp.]|nr:putative secreted protease [Conexibacter sp.]
VLALACTVAAAAPASAVAQFSASQRAAMRQAVQGAMAAGGYPGMAAGIWVDGHGSWVGARGTSGGTAGRPLHTSDRFRVGSITKTMTATIVLQLVQEHRLRLDERLSRFTSAVPYGGDVTVRQLLDHTSGIPDLAPSTVLSLVKDPTQTFDVNAVIAAAVAQPRLSPGWHYSNTNYLLLGKIVERLTRHSIAHEVRARIVGALGLAHTTFDPGTRLPSPHANGSTVLEGRRLDVTAWTTSYTWAAGSLVSTLGDLRRWARPLAVGTLLDRGEQRQRLRWVKTTIPGIRYGLGIFRWGDFLGHDGLVFGYDSTMLYSPKLHATVVVLGNAAPEMYVPAPAQPPSSLAVAASLVALAFPQLAGAPRPHRVSADGAGARSGGGVDRAARELPDGE